MAKTSGLPLGLIWKDHINPTPPQPYPRLQPCSLNNLQADGSVGSYRITIDAGSSKGVMRVLFNTGNYFLPSAETLGPAKAANNLPDRLSWSHGSYYNQDDGSSIGGNFYANDSSGATDVPVVSKDSENLTSFSNLQRVKQKGMIGGERFFRRTVTGSDKILAISNLRGSIPPSNAHHANGSPVAFSQNVNGEYENIPVFDYDETLNSGAGGFAQLQFNGVNQTTTLGPYGGWIDRNTNKIQSTLTPNMKTSAATGAEGDLFDIEADWPSSGSLGLQLHSAGSVNSVQQAETFFPSFHANRNTVYCIPMEPTNPNGTVELVVDAPLGGTWFAISYECPIDMETADSGKHKLTRSALRTNWNQTCNTGTVNTTVYHMPVDYRGSVNPASVGRDENGIPVKTVNTYSPALNHSNGSHGNRVVSDVRGSESRDLWENLVSNYYITQNGRGGANSWKAALNGGATPESLVRDWYGMQDCVKSSGSFSSYGFPASNQITVPNVTAVSGAPATASTNIEVGDLVVTGSDNNFGANGTNGNIKVESVNGNTITVSGMTMSTQTALTGLDPVLTFVRMGDIQTKGYLDPAVYMANPGEDDVSNIGGQPAGDIGIRDYLFEDRYGANPLPDGFYKIIDKNGVDNGNGGKKRVKVKDGIIIKCRNCFGSIKNR